MSNSLWPHGLQHAWPLCPSLSPKVCKNSFPWVGDASYYLIFCCPLLLLPSIFPSIRAFPVSQLFVSGGQSIRASASASVLPMNIQGWFPLGLTGLISLLSKGLKNLLQHHSLKISILWHSAFFMIQLSHPYMTTGKIIALSIQTFVGISFLLYFIFVLTSLDMPWFAYTNRYTHKLAQSWRRRQRKPKMSSIWLIIPRSNSKKTKKICLQDACLQPASSHHFCSTLYKNFLKKIL